MKTFMIALVCLCAMQVKAQLVTFDRHLDYTLPDGGQVTLLPALQQPGAYYALPALLRLSVNEGRPEFLAMFWQTDQAEQQALMHWLLTWGPDRVQDSLIRKHLSQVDSTAVLMGTLSVTAPEKYVFSGKNRAAIAFLEQNLQTGGGIPTSAGGKSASSFKAVGAAAELLEKNIRNPDFWKDVFIEMPFMDLQGRHLCTLQVEVQTLIRQANTCADCIVVPE